MKTELGPNGVTLIKECFSGQYKQVVLVKLMLAKDTQNNSNYLTRGGGDKVMNRPTQLRTHGNI